MNVNEGLEKRAPSSTLKRWFALAAITVFYGFAILIAKLFGSPRRRDRAPERIKILAIGTFHNPNWFLAHITPIAKTGVAEILLVADGHITTMDNVRQICPPEWACKIFSRAGAKALWAFGAALRERPDLYMGYAIFPAATVSLVLGRIFRRPAAFQLTSGALELDGGGNAAENRMLGALGAPSAWAEKLAFALTRQFELIIVRGSRAEHYLRELGFAGAIETVTGSVAMPETVADPLTRPIDMIFVGRLTERKRPDDFVDVVARLKPRFPDIKAIMVGDGPELDAIDEKIRKLRLTANIELAGLRSDVDQLLSQAKLFVLTSRWEGVSIAMLESMSAGCVPVCSDVGDLADVLADSSNGYLLKIGDIEGFSDRITRLLGNDEQRLEYSAAARATAVNKVSREAITQRWQEILAEHAR